MQIATDFENKWNFPNCIGALDGKHLTIKAPANSGSLYFNYKGTFSIVLMALVDANYKFIYVNIGAKGRISDGGVFNNCNLASALEHNTLKIPHARPLPGRQKSVPFVVVADDAFAMKPYLMKPFSFQNQNALERTYNYRLSRARRNVENVFGLISARFRVLRRTVELSPEKVILITSAICALHNFLMTKSARVYTPPGTFDIEIDGQISPAAWRSETNNSQYFQPLNSSQSRHYSNDAKIIRNEFKEYFMSQQGEVPWQYKYI